MKNIDKIFVLPSNRSLPLDTAGGPWYTLPAIQSGESAGCSWGGTRFLERKLCKELYTAVAGLES